jgi:hypothetical protein
VQPANLHLLRDHEFRVRIFLGAAQERIPLSMVSSLQVFGPALEYIQTKGIGPNALDFYIAYFLGRQSLEFPHARFYVISHDTGFDPLMRHLRSAGLACRRVISVEEILSEHEVLEAVHALPVQQLLERTVNHLSRPAITRPRAIKTLRSTINALFGKKLSESQIDNVILEMKNNGFVLKDSPRITYKLDQPGRHNAAANSIDPSECSAHDKPGSHKKSGATPELADCIN